MSENIFTDQNFENEVLKSDAPVLVDFWAVWCGPCRIQGPIVEKLASEYAGKPVKIGKLNVDENMATSQKYEIMSIPTLAIFKGGQVIERMVGVQSEAALKQKIEQNLH